ncbi:hypothetical protein C4J81_06845 [Deltaproteobacteria bacterium Smac51]|nr:hypothetical protein C4J81_06845 [Deltaproteobacteria bacterium Smac51]
MLMSRKFFKRFLLKVGKYFLDIKASILSESHKVNHRQKLKINIHTGNEGLFKSLYFIMPLCLILLAPWGLHLNHDQAFFTFNHQIRFDSLKVIIFNFIK